MTESNHQGSTTQAGFFVPGQGAAQGSSTADEDRTAETTLGKLEADDAITPIPRAFDESTIGRKLPEAHSEFRHTVPGPGDANTPGVTAPTANPTLTATALDEAAVDSLSGRPAFGPPAPPPSAETEPKWRKLPPRKPRGSNPPAAAVIAPTTATEASIVVDPALQHPPDDEIKSFLAALDAARPAETDFFGRPDQVVTVILPAVPEPTEVLLDDPSSDSDDRRSQRQAVAAAIGFLLTVVLAITGIQVGARLTGGESRGMGGAIADLVTNQTRPQQVPTRSVPVVVATVRHTPPTKLVVAQRPVQAPVLRPVSPPHAPTPTPTPVPVIRPAAPPAPPPSVAAPNVPPTPTAALPRCRTNGSFANEAEAVRQGYTLVYLFPGQTRSANTPVCRPE